MQCCATKSISREAAPEWPPAAMKHFVKSLALCNLSFIFRCQTKIAADDILIFYFYLSKKIRLDFSCESSARLIFHVNPLLAEVSFETSSLISSEKH